MCRVKNFEDQISDSVISPLPLANLHVTEGKRSKRYKLWEIPETRHCMVIGTCLGVSEARAQLERVGLDVSHLCDYQIHTYAVQTAGDKKNHLAVRLQRLLDDKYAVDIRRFKQAKTTEQLSTIWYESVRQGMVAGSVWAVCTHPCIDEHLAYEVFGEVHMMSHLQGASGRKENANLKMARARARELEVELVTLRAAEQRRRERDLGQITKLNQEVSELRIKSFQNKPESAKEVAAEKSSKQLVRQRQLAVLQNEKLERQREEIQQLKDERLEMNTALEELGKSNVGLEQTIENLLPCGAKKDDCEPDLRGRCILYLGGHNHLCQRFRTIVESKKGEFLHHDGGREQQLKHLQGLLQKADMVFCPTEKISHNAMNKARKLCRDNPEKPIVFLERPSITAFVNGLNNFAVLDEEPSENCIQVTE